MNQYIRQRESGSWQFRYYTQELSCSYTHKDLEHVIEYRNKFLGYDPDALPLVEPKILVLDIETSPMVVYAWRLGDQYVDAGQIIKDWFLLCVGHKWLGAETTDVLALIDYGDPVDVPLAVLEMDLVADLYKLLEEADVVVAHNGDRFDIKKINTKFLLAGLPRPALYRTVDTLKILKKHFAMSSNKLDYVDKYLGHTGKLEHSGLQLWIDCMAGKPEAWATMIEYNKRDIDILEQRYLDLRGWDGSHPNLGHFYRNDGSPGRCPNCGHTKFEETKPYVTKVSSFPTFRCKECSALLRGRRSIERQKFTGVC